MSNPFTISSYDHDINAGTVFAEFSYQGEVFFRVGFDLTYAKINTPHIVHQQAFDAAAAHTPCRNAIEFQVMLLQHLIERVDLDFTEDADQEIDEDFEDAAE